MRAPGCLGDDNPPPRRRKRGGDKAGRHRHIGAVTLPSPCTNVCRIDPVSGWCEGCGRTLDEIARWPLADEAEQRAIITALPGRMASPRRRLGVRW